MYVFVLLFPKVCSLRFLHYLFILKVFSVFVSGYPELRVRSGMNFCACVIRVCEPGEAGLGGGQARGTGLVVLDSLPVVVPRPSCSPTSGPAALSWEPWDLSRGRVTEEALQPWGPALRTLEAAGVPGESWGLQVTCSGSWASSSVCTLMSPRFSGLVPCLGLLCCISTSGSSPGPW